MRDNKIGELIDKINDMTAQYAAELGVKTSSDGFISCLYPDHVDSDPSMHWWDEKGIFYCFGCGRTVNAISLAHIFEGKPLAGPDFIEDNVFYLAEKFGFEYEHLRREMTAEEMQRQQFFRTMKLFSEYVTGHINEDYIAKRGIEKTTAEKLLIGSVKNHEDCLRFLINSGCNNDVIKAIGIDNYKVNEKKMILIIKDEYGRPCSFVSRDMFWSKETGGPKYINGNATDIFDKSRIFFGWSDITKEYNPMIPCVIVEGYLDFVAAYQRGIRNIVAIGSASFTDEHIAIIEKERRIKTVAIALDQDDTGKKRMERIMDRLKSNSNTIKTYNFAVYKQQGKDIDEILKDNPMFKKTSDIFELKSLFEYQLMVLKDKTGADIDESQLFDNFVALISKTKTPKEREEQARTLSKYLNNYSYSTILDQISYLIDGKESLFKDEIVKLSKRAIEEVTLNPDYAGNIVEQLNEDIRTVATKYDKSTKNIFDLAMEAYNKFEVDKTNANLFEVDFGIPWLNNLNIMPGNSVVLSSVANTGKSTLYQHIAKMLIKGNDNTTVFYCSTDDPGEKIYANLIASLTGLIRDYCTNPYFHKKYGINKEQNDTTAKMFDIYQRADEYIRNLITQKRLVILDVKYNVDTWRGLEKAMKDIANDKDMENQYKVLIIDSANKIVVDGIQDENAAAGFLSSNIKKMSEKYKFLSFINFELNKTKNNARLSQYSLSGSRRMFYDCDILGFVYNPSKNLQEFKGTDQETKMMWDLKLENGTIWKMPILVTVEGKSKAGDNLLPYFYKLNTMNNQVTAIEPNTLEYNTYLEIWFYEFNEFYKGF